MYGESKKFGLESEAFYHQGQPTSPNFVLIDWIMISQQTIDNGPNGEDSKSGVNGSDGNINIIC